MLLNIEIIPQERFNGESVQTLKIFRFLWFKTLFCGSKFYGKTRFLRG